MNGRRHGAAVVAALAGLALAGWASPVAAQEEEAVMVAAGQWALGRLPSGDVRLDPHRSGQSTNPAVARRVAQALGARLGTLEETRRCDDVMDPSTCRLASASLLAISPGRIGGDRAQVRVYVWYRQDSPREPVAKASWDVTLRRTASGWEVAGNGVRLD